MPVNGERFLWKSKSVDRSMGGGKSTLQQLFGPAFSFFTLAVAASNDRL
jgi:hypothetical protein